MVVRQRANEEKLVRGTGRISFSSDSALYIPSVGDSPGDLELKWQQFATIESYKRFFSQLLLYMILADRVQADDASVHSRCAIFDRFVEELKHDIQRTRLYPTGGT